MYVKACAILACFFQAMDDLTYLAKGTPFMNMADQSQLWLAAAVLWLVIAVLVGTQLKERDDR